MREINYDENQVPAYTLPDPLLMQDGTAVVTADMWVEQRRPELLSLFEEHIYGRCMPAPDAICFDIIDETDDAISGNAVRKQVAITIKNQGREHTITLLLYHPCGTDKAAGVFLALNFRGNHSISHDPAIRLPDTWMPEGKGVQDHQATDAGRGLQTERWCVEKIIKRGYGLATIYYGDLDPDFDDGYQYGIHPLFYTSGQNEPADNEAGAIGAWAWGLSRAMDYLQSDNDIDSSRIIVIGHSRLGKTALWAGVQDKRFAAIISNNSGCGGAALARRCFGETIARINDTFPHWFCNNFRAFNDREDTLPIDQHMLIALCAPRPVYIASASEDAWADPRGEFLGALHAAPVYRLLGMENIHLNEMPENDQPVHGTISYHIRTGKHGVTDFDWDCYLDFADTQLGSTQE